MVRKKYLSDLKKFRKNLEKILPVEKMIFFGSRAVGTEHQESDIDLILVSKKFKNMDFRKRSLGLYKYWNLPVAFDFLCYTPKEFNKLKNQITIVREAVKEGIEIE